MRNHPGVSSGHVRCLAPVVYRVDIAATTFLALLREWP
jgi:hypothetical protein